jgi:LPS export ABC transporter protein LptC
MAVLLLIAGCEFNNSSKNEVQPPFKFRELKLHQNNINGQKLWDLFSPRASYRIDQRTAAIENPSGSLYRNGYATYNISASSGVVLNDGEQIELLNNVKLITLDQRKIIITTDRAIWHPSKNTIDLVGNPKATDPTRLLRSGKARFHVQSELLELRNSPSLQQWRRRLSPTQLPELDLLVESVNWYLISGKLLASGPVSSLQRPNQNQKRFLDAASLEGNTKDQWLDFYPPVILRDPSKNMVLKAGLSRWWIKDARISSGMNAEAKIGGLTVSGSNLELQDQNQLIRIGSDCEFKQPGEQLTANSCSWNWQTGDIYASGDVLLMRSQFNQSTKASKMQGKTGKDGIVSFSSPGEQVQTRLQFPRGVASDKTKSTPIQF